MPNNEEAAMFTKTIAASFVRLPKSSPPISCVPRSRRMAAPSELVRAITLMRLLSEGTESIDTEFESIQVRPGDDVTAIVTQDANGAHSRRWPSQTKQAATQTTALIVVVGAVTAVVKLEIMCEW